MKAIESMCRFGRPSQRIIRTAAGLLAVSLGASAEPPTDLQPIYQSADGVAWPLIWSDEFDGDQLDSSKWASGLPWTGSTGQTPGRHHNDLYASYIMDDEIRVADGTLRLSTQRREITAPNGDTFDFTQAMITTSGKFEQKYGYFEVRVKLPVEAGPGLWPAFWTLSGTGWPPEMDICEIWTSTNRNHQGLAYRKEDGGVGWDDRNTNTPLPTGWQTFGMEWGPGYQFYDIDGEVTKRLHGDHVTDIPHYLLLNSGVDAKDPPTAATRFPNTFEVDYVRVFERPDRPVIHNAGFEWDSLWPWEGQGQTVQIAFNAAENHRAVRVDGGPSGLEQKVFGLKPNTAYALRAQARVVVDGADAFIGVKNHDSDAEIKTSTDSPSYVPLQVEFVTGHDSSTATIFCSVPGANGAALFDAFSIVRIPEE